MCILLNNSIWHLKSKGYFGIMSFLSCLHPLQKKSVTWFNFVSRIWAKMWLGCNSMNIQPDIRGRLRNRISKSCLGRIFNIPFNMKYVWIVLYCRWCYLPADSLSIEKSLQYVLIVNREATLGRGKCGKHLALWLISWSLRNIYFFSGSSAGKPI